MTHTAAQLDATIYADGARAARLGDIPAGEYFKRKADARKVYRRADYDRSARKYWADDCDDISRGILLKSDTIVFIGFTY